MIMAIVPVMHKHVHEWACRQEQPWQPGQDVRPVLGNQEKGAYDGKGDEHYLHSWVPSALFVSRLFRHSRLHVHG
jgi:hypothetical protein